MRRLSLCCRIRIFFAVIFFLSTFISVVDAAPKNTSKTLILKARLFKVEAFDPKSVVDALDPGSMQGAIPTATVSFLVESVLKGELPLQKSHGSTNSLLGQAKDAVHEKSFLKLVTMDFENPDVEHPDRSHWFLVGVQSPLETFNVISWKDLPSEPYKLVFSQKNDESGWVLQSSEKIS